MKIAEKEAAEDAKGGSTCATFSKPAKGRGGRGIKGRKAASNRDLARKTGRSYGSIQKDRKRAEVIGVDNLDKISGTSLDKGIELNALVKLPEEIRAPGILHRLPLDYLIDSVYISVYN